MSHLRLLRWSSRRNGNPHGSKFQHHIKQHHRIIPWTGSNILLHQPRLINNTITSRNLENELNKHLAPLDRILQGLDRRDEPCQHQWPYIQVIGVLNYIATMSWPDITFAVHHCIRFRINLQMISWDSHTMTENFYESNLCQILNQIQYHICQLPQIMMDLEITKQDCFINHSSWMYFNIPSTKRNHSTMGLQDSAMLMGILS